MEFVLAGFRRGERAGPVWVDRAEGADWCGRRAVWRKRLDTPARLGEIARVLPSVKLTIVVPLDDPHPDLTGIPHGLRWQDEIAFFAPQPIVYEQLPFEHPLYILYSSGTTGRPKCMVHGAGGTLIQHLKEMVLHRMFTPAF